MRELLLLVVLFITFGFGFFLMHKLDCFLEENRKIVNGETDIQVPSHVLLTEELSNEEINEEIQRFRSKHAKMRIMIYDDMDEVDEM